MRKLLGFPSLLQDPAERIRSKTYTDHQPRIDNFVDILSHIWLLIIWTELTRFPSATIPCGLQPLGKYFNSVEKNLYIIITICSNQHLYNVKFFYITDVCRQLQKYSLMSV